MWIHSTVSVVLTHPLYLHWEYVFTLCVLSGVDTSVQEETVWQRIYSQRLTVDRQADEQRWLHKQNDNK